MSPPSATRADYCNALTDEEAGVLARRILRGQSVFRVIKAVGGGGGLYFVGFPGYQSQQLWGGGRVCVTYRCKIMGIPRTCPRQEANHAQVVKGRFTRQEPLFVAWESSLAGGVYKPLSNKDKSLFRLRTPQYATVPEAPQVKHIRNPAAMKSVPWL